MSMRAKGLENVVNLSVPTGIFNGLGRLRKGAHRASLDRDDKPTASGAVEQR